MGNLHSMVDFVLKEGALLAVLFFVVAMVVAMLQQSVGQKLSGALGKVSLETGSVLAATAGAVTPFCSCSTVPILSGMLQARVRFGVCFTFLIASPVINEGVMLVLLRQSIPQAILFLAVAFVLSVGFGIFLDRIGMARFVKVMPALAGIDGAVHIDGSAPTVPLKARLRFAAQTAWHELKSSAPYLAIGIFAGALIYGYVPQEALVQLKAWFPGWILIVVMALIGVPFYVNAAMVIPIAVALMEKGLGIGPVAAFLVSAAGTSIPEMVMLLRLFKVPLILWHVATIVICATVIGLALEYGSMFF
jgi:uncharacterized membrane protein YraQ (UPF0718 family)